jgi:carbamoyl-phosphate synthase large subunit
MEEAKEIADKLGYPLMVRPSYVLGGGDGGSFTTRRSLRFYLKAAVAELSPERPILIDKFLDNAIEAEADAIADGKDAFVPAVMEHIELAGIHSGDSACVIPPISIAPKHIETIREYTRKIAVELNVVGLMNIQYAIYENTVYVLEANPRASRTVPLVSKICDISMARLAMQVMLGKSHCRPETRAPASSPITASKRRCSPSTCSPRSIRCWGRKCVPPEKCWAFPTRIGRAFFKAQEATQDALPLEGSVLFTIADRDKAAAIEPAIRLFRSWVSRS